MLMWKEGIKVFISSDPVDMRKAIDGLALLVVDVLKQNPQSGQLFLFYSRSRKKVKALYWDRNGFVLFYKRLEQGHFSFPRRHDGVLEISLKQLSWLLAGLDFMGMARFPELDYSGYY